MPFILLAFTAILFFSYGVYKSSSERNVKQYFSNLSADRISQIGIFAFGEYVEVCDVREQTEILNHLSKMEVTLGGSHSDTQADGGIIMSIQLFYKNGSIETITLPAFTYTTILGNKDFYIWMDGEDILQPFEKHFSYDWS